MKLIIDIDENVFTRLFDNGTEDYAIVNDDLFAIAKSIRKGTPLEQTEQFAEWVAREIFDDMWEYNKDAFAEIACRKLAKLGIVREKGNEWELVEPQERSEE